MKPNIYNFLDIVKNKICYVGKHNGSDTSYVTGGKILLRYRKIFGKKAFNSRFKKQIIEFCELSELNSREVYWIKFYGTYKNGLNLTRGGDYDWKYKLPKCKKVLKYDKEGNFIEIYEGVIQASKLNDLNRTAVSDCVTGKQSSAGGFMWRFYNGFNIPNKIEPYKKSAYKKNRVSNSKWWVSYNNKIYPSVQNFAISLYGKRLATIPLEVSLECKFFKRLIEDINTGEVFETIDNVCKKYNKSRNFIQSRLCKVGTKEPFHLRYVLIEVPAEQVIDSTNHFKYLYRLIQK